MTRHPRLGQGEETARVRAIIAASEPTVASVEAIESTDGGTAARSL
jgi:hypothetical protein